MSNGPIGAVGAHAPRPRAQRASVVAAVAAAVALAALPTTAEAAPSRAGGGAPVTRTVTLVTGDVVHVSQRANGRRAVTFEAGPDGTLPDAAVTETGDHLYVVPRSAMRLVASKRLDLDLFDVAGLVRQRYDDARRGTLPVIVDYGRGPVAAAESRRAALRSARKTVALPRLGAAAYAASKRGARRFWRSLTGAPDAAGRPTALTGGAMRVDLDGRVQATVDPNVEQVHAPQAWAAGFDGSGTTVAVLDSGYDPGHPDLDGPVSATANFTTEDGVRDGNGHGTHVASTIAGTGAASLGVHGGVAPGTHLLIGKVLGAGGFGEDSWVLAGMEWAVTSGADVVNMSLGGSDPSDGTDPMSRAVDELSASSDTLFVIAAGNNGGAGTVTSPGAADAALTVGAVDGADAMAWFSSRGPRLGDAAVKPDVVAPGVGIVAARADGTSLGSPVDAFYTSLEGTSMATPHVAGVAAILKQRHPDWDGERLKAAIVASAVAVPDATAFDAGTGRVDAARAIAQTVVAGSSLRLGFYPWPQGGLAPSHTPLTYTNLGSVPVDLALAIASEDGLAPAPAGVSLGASHLVVPAGGTASVDVILDPAAATVGPQSGVVVADDGAGTTVRTALGFELESEHHDLTVRVEPRAGTRAADHTVGMLDLDTFAFAQRTLTGTGPQSTTFRVPPGTYAVGGITFGLAADGALEGVAAQAQPVRVDAATTVVLDEGRARRFDIETDRPVLTDGQILSIDWNGATATAGVTFAGAVDRLYAQPMTSTKAGKVNAALNWLASQPDAVVEPATGAPVPLRTVPVPGVREDELDPAGLDGSFRIVDAGTAEAPATAAVAGSVAVVSGRCDDVLDGAADALSGAGAVAMVVYAAEGQSCAGTLGRAPALPVFETRPFDAGRLRTARRPAHVGTHRDPSYVYDLADWWDGRVPTGATLDGRDGHVASLVERYDSLGGTTRDGVDVREMMIGWIVSRGAAAYGLVRPVGVPGTVTRYVSEGPEWERQVDVYDGNGFLQASLYAPQQPVTAGTTVRDRWFGGPLAPNASPLLAQFGWQAYPYRQQDFLWLFMPSIVDRDGHTGSAIYLDEFHGALYRNGELVTEADDPIWLSGWVPPEPADYRLVYTMRRKNTFWQRSTMSRSEWGFHSKRTPGDHAVLPLLSVDLDLPLSTLNTAPAGPFSFGVAFRMPLEVAFRPVRDVTVEVSWDGGGTWQAAPLRGCTGKGCTVDVDNRTAGAASLRITAADTAGRSIRQTILDAYVVR